MGTVLHGVTGKRFGEDAARWRKWRAENRKRYERASALPDGPPQR